MAGVEGDEKNTGTGISPFASRWSDIQLIQATKGRRESEESMCAACVDVHTHRRGPQQPRAQLPWGDVPDVAGGMDGGGAGTCTGDRAGWVRSVQLWRGTGWHLHKGRDRAGALCRG